jgi:hypothetical protein
MTIPPTRPRAKKDDWVDAQQMHLQYPDTFAVPSEEELAAVKAGYSVKISNGKERFWVEITRRSRNGRLYGKVANNLVFDHGYDLGDLVVFKQCNIYDISTPEERMLIRLLTQNLPPFSELAARVPTDN